MSSVLIVAPLVIAAWPTLTAAISAAVGTLGFAAAQKAAPQVRQVQDSVNRAEIELEDSEILEGTGATGEEMVVERDGVRAVFSRDARGSLKVCLEGRDLSKSELKQLGEDLIGRVTQQYVYHRLVSELKEHDMNIVEEQVTEDQTIKIRVRHL